MVKTLRLTAVTLTAILIVAFQLQLLPFFSSLFVNNRLFWPIIYYGYWSLVIGLTLVILATQRSIFHRSLPILVVCAFAAGLILIHPLDSISRNFLVAMILVACATVLAIASAPMALLMFSASATVLSAVICLLDILFSHGFTDTLGRAAGFSVNANVAAGGMLLGAASSFWAIPHRMRGPFLLIVGAAIFVTLSKSTLLAAIVICAVVGADLVWTLMRSPGSRPRIRWFRSGVLAFGLAGWIVAALFLNDRFSLAATLAYQGIGGALTAFADARQSITSAVESRVLSQSSIPPSANDNVEPKSNSDDLIREMNSRDELIKEIGRRAENEGEINSISARGLLLERAFLSYQTGPFFGQGLAAAYALQPHNTFLLFAIAFGHLGWLVPIAFLGLTACWTRSVQQLPLFLATLTGMAISHDILLTPGLLTPIVIGVAGLNALRYGADEAPCALSTMRYTAVAAPISFALGSASIAGIGLSGVQAPPNLLVFLVFSAITLWSVAVWLWSEKLMRQHQSALPRG
jgi:hypothetical protein